MNRVLQQGGRAIHLFHPVHHLWLRASPVAAASASATSSSQAMLNGFYRLDIGLTKRGMDDIGDITSVERFVPSEKSVRDGDCLVKIEWEGHSITSADELYHTVWETFSGSKSVTSPVSGTIHKNDESVKNEDTPKGTASSRRKLLYVDETTVLTSIKAAAEDLEGADQGIWVDEEEYLRIIRTMPPGMFAEPEDSDQTLGGAYY